MKAAKNPFTKRSRLKIRMLSPQGSLSHSLSSLLKGHRQQLLPDLELNLLEEQSKLEKLAQVSIGMVRLQTHLGTAGQQFHSLMRIIASSKSCLIFSLE